MAKTATELEFVPVNADEFEDVRDVVLIDLESFESYILQAGTVYLITKSGARAKIEPRKSPKGLFEIFYDRNRFGVRFTVGQYQLRRLGERLRQEPWKKI